MRLTRHKSLRWAAFTQLGKFPEALGVLQFCKNRIALRKSRLIEYK
jgi:hypothetical protein